MFINGVNMNILNAKSSCSASGILIRLYREARKFLMFGDENLRRNKSCCLVEINLSTKLYQLTFVMDVIVCDYRFLKIINFG